MGKRELKDNKLYIDDELFDPTTWNGEFTYTYCIKNLPNDWILKMSLQNNQVVYINKEGYLHNLHGPALITATSIGYYIDGVSINVSSNDEFERYCKLRSFW